MWKTVMVSVASVVLTLLVIVGVAWAADIFTIDKDGTVRLVITNTGNVGIGADSPESRLVVRGAGTTSATSSLDVQTSSGTSRLFVRDDGNVGIGTSSPSVKLDVSGDLKINGGLLHATASYPISAGQTLYIADSDIPRDGVIIISVDGNGDTPGTGIFQVYRSGTYNGVYKTAGSVNWKIGDTSNPGDVAWTWSTWIENNNAGGRLVLKNNAYNRTIRIYSIGYN